MNIKEYIQQQKERCKGLSFAFLAERVAETADAPYRFNVAQPVKADEPLVLVLGGTGTYGQDNIRGYNGYAKQVTDFLQNCPELQDKNFRVCVAVCNAGNYHDEDMAREGKILQRIAPEEYQNICADKQGTELQEFTNPAYIRDIFNSAILPRISANGGKIRLSRAQALRNIRRLNIVTHCHGAYVASCLNDMMTDKMQELGYSEKERKEVQKQLMVLNYAGDYVKRRDGFRYIDFESAADDHAKYQPTFKEWIQMKCKKFSLSYRHNWLMCGQIDKAGIEGNPKRVWVSRKVEGDFFDEIVASRKENKENEMKEPEEEKTLSEHAFLGFKPKSNMSKAALKMQKFFGNVLKNAVVNSCNQPKDGFNPLPPTTKLMAETISEKLEIMKAAWTDFKLIQQFAHRNDKKLMQYMAWHQNSRITLD